jgi:hypothetical protein
MTIMRAVDVENYKPAGISSSTMGKSYERKHSRVDVGLRHRSGIFEILSDCIDDPPPNVTSADPIWATEARHRAFNLLRLISSSNGQHAEKRIKSNDFIAEYKLAQDLIDTYRTLKVGNESTSCSCEEMIEVSIRGLLATFQSAIGVVEVNIRTLALNLPSHKRRALVLLLGELALSMLLDKSERGASGRLTLLFSRAGSDQMNVKMETSCPLPRSFSAPGYDIVCALSGIVGAEFVYTAAPTGGTRVELLVPFETKIRTVSDFGYRGSQLRRPISRYSR